MKKIINEMKLRLPAVSVNEAVARSCISAFVAEANPTVEELCDLRCAVSEAVTNCIVHAYRGYRGDSAYIYISARLYETREVSVEVSDNGCGIEDIEKARAPMYTTGEPSETESFAVLALNSLQNCMMLTPAEPRAGPTGGAGFAAPAGIWSFTTPVTFFAILVFAQSLASHGQSCTPLASSLNPSFLCRLLPGILPGASGAPRGASGLSDRNYTPPT